MQVKPVSMGNTSAYFTMLAEAMTSTQFVREFVVNMIESGATQGFIGFVMHKVSGTSRMVRKSTFSDNGCGMDASDLKKFIGKIASSSGTIAKGKNHGIGAKISAAFRNKLGMSFQSWTDVSDPREEGNMVTFAYDDGLDEYGLATYDTGDVVDAPEISKAAFKKRFLSKSRGEIKSGTTITLMGNDEDQDTSRAPSDWKPVATGRQSDSQRLLWLHNVLSWKFFEFPPGFELRVMRPKGSGPASEGYTNTNNGMKSYLDSESEARGKVEVPDGVCHWFLLKEHSQTKTKKVERSSKNKAEDGRKSDPRYGISRGFALLHRTPKYGYSEMYEPTVSIGFMRKFGFTNIARRLVVLFEPYNSAPDEKRLHLCSDSTGESFYSSGVVADAIQWFSHPENQPKELIAAEALEIDATAESKITSDDIKKWVKDAENALPFSDRLIAATHGIDAGEGPGGGGSKEKKKRKFNGRDPNGKGTGTHNKDGSGDADEGKDGLVEGTGRKASRRQAPQVEDIDITMLRNGEFDHNGAAEFNDSSPAKLVINREYWLFDQVVNQVALTKDVPVEQVDDQLARAVGKRLIYSLAALRALSKATGYGAEFFDLGTTPQALTAAIEATRFDIFADLKRNLGRFKNKGQHPLDG